MNISIFYLVNWQSSFSDFKACPVDIAIEQNTTAVDIKVAIIEALAEEYDEPMSDIKLKEVFFLHSNT